MSPTLDLESQAFGPLRLGDPEERAKEFRHPGLEIDVVDGKVACFKFNIDAGSSVNVAGDIRLTRATKPLDAQVWFGEPSSDSARGNLRWIDFERGGATLALEFDAKGLDCVQLYAEGYA